MQRIFDFFSWFFEINCKTTLKETEKMNFLRLFKESVLKTSYVIKKNTSKTLVTKSTLPTWPEWSEWNDSTIGAENFETETFQMFNLKNKVHYVYMEFAFLFFENVSQLIPKALSYLLPSPSWFWIKIFC